MFRYIQHYAHAIDVGGKSRRAFLHRDDATDVCVFLLEQAADRLQRLFSASRLQIVNIGYGEDMDIGELSGQTRDVVGFRDDIVFDPSGPDGTMQKLVDGGSVSRMEWKATIIFLDGATSAYDYRREVIWLY